MEVQEKLKNSIQQNKNSNCERNIHHFPSLLLLAAGNLRSQNVVPTAQGVENLLCKKWIIDYALMGDASQDVADEQKDIVLEFKKNKTFTLVAGSKCDNLGAGSWLYDPAKKMIKLMIHGKVQIIVTHLTDTELTTKFAMKTGMPEDKLTFVYKTKTP